MISPKFNKTFYYFIILLLKEKMNGHITYLHKPNIFEIYQNLKILYTMKVI